jgi:hypothetical protein
MTSHIGGNFGKYTYQDHRALWQVSNREDACCLMMMETQQA